MFHLHPTMRRRYDAQKAGRCIVNRKRKLACVLVPKNASTTMRSVLGPYELRCDAKPRGHGVVKECSIVMIVREPFARFVSSYAEVEHRLRDPKTALPILCRQSFTKVRGWKDRFVRFIQDVHKGIFDQHLVQQSRHFVSMRSPITEWMVFERLGEQLPAYMRRHGIKRKVPHRKRSKNKALNAKLLALLLNERRLRDAVHEMYREAFRLYKEKAHA